MILEFENGTHTRKELTRTDMVEDIFDVVQAFFEEHRFRPPYMRFTFNSDEWKIDIGSMTEFFFVKEFEDENIGDMKQFLSEVSL